MEFPPKCLRCSARFLDGNLAVFDRGQLVHVRCHRILTGAEQVRKAQRVGVRAKGVAAKSQEPPSARERSLRNPSPPSSVTSL